MDTDVHCNSYHNLSKNFFFLDTGKIILKFIWKYMGPKTILRKNIVGGIILSNFKLHSYNNHECGFGRRIDPQISGTK